MIEEIKNAHQNPITLPSGASYDWEDMLKRINCNWEGIYADNSGDDDILGKRPYDNGVVVSRGLLEARATDYSISNIDVEPKNGSRKARVSAMIQRKALSRFADTHNLAGLLDEITFTSPKYGGVLIKKSKDDVAVVPWENVKVDQTDILGNPILERHYMRPSELLSMKAWKNAKEVIKKNAKSNRDANVNNQAKNNNETTGNSIEVWEMHGEVQLSKLKECQNEMGKKEQEITDDDEFTYVLAHVVKSGDIYLYADTIDELPYMFYARNKQTNRAMGQSVYEQLREHQKWHNFTKTEEMRMIAIAGKVFYHTDDSELFAKINNMYRKGVDHGTVLYHKTGTQFGQVNTTPSTLPAYQNIRTEWDNSANDITSSYASVTGAEQKAGTPFRAQALQNAMGSTQFTQYRNQIGEQIIRPMMQKWILPMALAELEEDLYAEFSPEELMWIDEVIVASKQAELYVRKTLDGEIVTEDDMFGVQLDTAQELAKSGNKRTIKGIKEFIKNANTQVKLHLTDEQRNKAFMYESFANILAQLQPGDPRREALLDKVMDMVGISRDELSIYENKAKQQEAQQAQIEAQQAKMGAMPQETASPVQAQPTAV